MDEKGNKYVWKKIVHKYAAGFCRAAYKTTGNN